MTAKPSIAMTDGELRAFAGRMRFAAVCAVGPDGELVARLARHRQAGEALEFDRTGAAADLPASANACALIDTFPHYTQIEGAMFRGRLETAGGSGRLSIEHASGFDFQKMPAQG